MVWWICTGISNSIDTTIFSSTGTAVDTANLTDSNKQGCGKETK